MPPEYIDIPAVPMGVAQRTQKNHGLAIGNDVCGVMADLKAINEGFHAHYDPYEQVFVLELHLPLPEGGVKEHFVGAYTNFDQRLVQRARIYCDPTYSLSAELDAIEAQADADHERERKETWGDLGEKLNFAFKKDLGSHEIPSTLHSRAYINSPAWVEPSPNGEK